MFCRYCGRELDDGTSFCPACGQPTDLSGPRSYGTPRRGPKGSGVTGLIAIVVLLLVAVVLVFAMVGLSLDDEGSVRISDDVTVSGALADGTITVTDTGGGIEFYYNGPHPEGAMYVWRLLGVDGTEMEWTTHTPELLVGKKDIRPGPYAFKASVSGSAVNGGLTLYGTVTDTFEWVYEGIEHSVTVSYEYSEYERFASDSGTQTRGHPDKRIARLTSHNDTIAQLEKGLKAEYMRAHGGEAKLDGQDYADFILAFVQVCFDYTDDLDTFGYEEYWAFPIETLYLRCGDCEDTTFLCALLFDSAGYDAGVFLVPGHAFAAVSLDDYQEPSGHWVQSTGLHVFSYGVGGRDYLGCETTFDRPVPVGIISSDYTVTDDGEFLYQGESGTSQDGLYTIGDSPQMGKMFSMRNGFGGFGDTIAV